MSRIELGKDLYSQRVPSSYSKPGGRESIGVPRRAGIVHVP